MSYDKIEISDKVNTLGKIRNLALECVAGQATPQQQKVTNFN
jgi:hypothetical protein